MRGACQQAIFCALKSTSVSSAKRFSIRKMGRNRSQQDETPRRWSVPNNRNVLFSSSSIFDGETAEEASPSDGSQRGDEVDVEARAREFLNYLERYCGEIIRTRRDNFVDLKGFNEEEHRVTIDELDAAKENAEKVAKVQDFAGMSRVHIENAVEAGVMAFAESQILTRKRARDIRDVSRLEPERFMYAGVPESSTSEFAKRIRIERDNPIIETYVDFKTELKTKHEILARVEKINKLDKVREIVEAKQLRNRDKEAPTEQPKFADNKLTSRLRFRAENSVDFKTPENAMQRRLDPLDYNNIMDEFLDDRARVFVEENQLIARRRKTLAPTQRFLDL